ncbi:MAG: LamG-like jellyroll fold domain-containing protein [Planctomycetota bacterium]
MCRIGAHDSTDGVGIGYCTDYKPRFYTKYSTGTVQTASTAITVSDDRLSLFVAEWNSGAGSIKLTVDGVQAFSTTKTAPVHTDRTLTAGGMRDGGSDPCGILIGQFAFGGCMNGHQCSLGTADPRLRQGAVPDGVGACRLARLIRRSCCPTGQASRRACRLLVQAVFRHEARVMLLQEPIGLVGRGRECRSSRFDI